METSLEKEERREKKKEDLLRATGVSSVLCAPPASSPRPDRKEEPSAQNRARGGGGKAQRWRLLNPGTWQCLLGQLMWNYLPKLADGPWDEGKLAFCWLRFSLTPRVL